MIRAVITDIEGTTTSVSFVYDVLFPYFREHIDRLKAMADNNTEVHTCFENVVSIVRKETGKEITFKEVPAVLREWSLEDRKETNLKQLQGILWQDGYRSNSIKGHVYQDVKPNLQKWHDNGVLLGVYSSGSVAAQKLLFGHSEQGDMTPLFSHYFDTNVGNKRDKQSYEIIAKEMNIRPADMLFLSDVTEELDAAVDAGWCAIQVVREGTRAGKPHPIVESFNEIKLEHV